jgi:hypothetical protein
MSLVFSFLETGALQQFIDRLPDQDETSIRKAFAA